MNSTQTTRRSVLGVALILVITFCASFVVSKTTSGSLAWDTTEDKLYTLSDGSKKIVDKLEQQLLMKLFYTKQAVDEFGQDELRFYNNFYYRVRDLLREFERYADGKLILQEFDPRPYSDAELEADGFKLQRFPLTGNVSFVFGFALTSESGFQETIDFFKPEMAPQIEYKFAELLELATRGKKDKVGVLSSLPVAGDGMTDYMRQMMAMQGRQPQNPWVVIEHLKRFYEVITVETDAEQIDADIDYLVVIHPKNLGEKTLYMIDQFVMGGGKLMVFVDPHCYVDQPPMDPSNPMAGSGHDPSSELNRLTEKWGIRLDGKSFAGDVELGRLVPAKDRQSGRDVQVRFPGWLILDNEVALNQDEVPTQGLQNVPEQAADMDANQNPLKGIGMFIPGALRKTEDVGTTVVPLMKTTNRANTFTASAWELGTSMRGTPPDFVSMARNFETGIEELWLAARISGTIPSAFEKAPATEEPEPEEADKPEDGDKPGEEQAGDEQAGEAKTGEEKTGEEKTGEEKAGEEKTGDEKTGEEKTGEEQTGDQDPDAAKAEDQDPDQPEAAAEPESTHLSESIEPTTVIVVADVDILTDQLAYARGLFGGYQLRNANSTFFMNSLDFLSGSSDLISIRSRGSAQRPFTVVKEIEEEADKKTARQVAALEQEKSKFQTKLNDLRAQATKDNVALLQSEAIREQRQLEAELRRLDRELRDVQEQKLAEIEFVGNVWKAINMIIVPLIVLLVGVFFAVNRYLKRQVRVTGGTG